MPLIGTNPPCLRQNRMSEHHLQTALAQLRIPAGRRYQSIRPAEGRFIHDLVQDRQISDSLEIGLADGYSATCILTAHADTGGTHTAIDVFQSELFEQNGLRNLEILGYHDRLNFIESYSHYALPSLHQQGATFDFAFIDGGHLFEQVFLDFYYVDLMLRPGGMVLLHDAWMRSTQTVASFIRRNRPNYRRVRKTDRNLILFEKQAHAEEKPFYYFREFYTLRGLFSQPFVVWLIKSGNIHRLFPRED